MTGPVGRTILVVNGRIHEASLVRPAYVEDPIVWWRALGVLGVTLLALGAWVGAGLGAIAAVGGVVLFLAAGVAIGSERYGLATAFGAAGVVWTSTGIAVYLGTDPELGVSALAFGAVGVIVTVASYFGAFRHRARDSRSLSAA